MQVSARTLEPFSFKPPQTERNLARSDFFTALFTISLKMAARVRRKKVKRYPDRLMQHLRTFEDPNGADKSVIELAESWQFIKNEDTGEAGSTCPCGKIGIRYLMYIQHNELSGVTYVGSECIKIFKEKLRKVMKVADRLVRYGFKGKYMGITRNVRNPKLRFTLRSNHSLVKEINNFMLYFGRNNIPVFQNKYARDKHWECAIFPGNGMDSHSYAEAMNLNKGQRYKLKLKLDRWATGYGEGFSLYITNIAEVGNESRGD